MQHTNARQRGYTGLDVGLDTFPEEDHFSSVRSRSGRSIPFALRS